MWRYSPFFQKKQQPLSPLPCPPLRRNKQSVISRNNQRETRYQKLEERREVLHFFPLFPLDERLDKQLEHALAPPFKIEKAFVFSASDMLSVVSKRVQSPRSTQLGALARAYALPLAGARDRSSCAMDHRLQQRPRGLSLPRGAPASAPPASDQRRQRFLLKPARPLPSPPAATRKRGDGGEGSSSEATSSDSGGDLSELAASLTRSWWFRVPLQGAVALIVLAAVDAAYSGDWSRIGAISKGTEEALKPLVVALGGVHLVCAGVAGAAASRKGNSVPKAAAKAALVGFLAAAEAVFAEDGQGGQSGSLF